MDRRRLVVTPVAVALLSLAGPAWAGPPPPPPPTSDGGGAAPKAPNTAPPPPSSAERKESTPSDPLAIDQRTPDTDLGSNWAYSRGANQGPNYVREADDDPFLTVNPIGYYQGVTVGGGNLPPYAPKEIGGQSAVLTWAGFTRSETSSRVFFQLSASVEPEISIESARVFIKLPRTSVTVRNNLRPLITKYFKTPVNEVKVSKSGKDLIAVLELRWEATPAWHFETTANGYRVLVFEFPDAPEQVTPSEDGSTAPTPSTTPPPPPPPPPPGEPFLPGQ